uniref:DNA methylase N-4/N-6 domain-containing protein n=1 Tax=uncultured marine virus TaxID=186617 RepID=A0A0F7L6L3_9VIRU|nr:DNA methylase N-4/N-6 domain-containing protein [uncultured marine virus]
MLIRKMYSCDFVGRSVTLSGIGFGLCQMMSERRNHPSAWSANATRHGMPQRSFGLRPLKLRGGRFRIASRFARASSPYLLSPHPFKPLLPIASALHFPGAEAQ